MRGFIVDMSSYIASYQPYEPYRSENTVKIDLETPIEPQTI